LFMTCLEGVSVEALVVVEGTSIHFRLASQLSS